MLDNKGQFLQTIFWECCVAIAMVSTLWLKNHK